MAGSRASSAGSQTRSRTAVVGASVIALLILGSLTGFSGGRGAWAQSPAPDATEVPPPANASYSGDTSARPAPPGLYRTDRSVRVPTRQAVAAVASVTADDAISAAEPAVGALVPHVALQGPAEVLLIQDVNPWTCASNQQALQELGKSYHVMSAAEAMASDLSQYKIVMVASDQYTSTYDTLAANRSIIESYVGGGGVLVAHATDEGWHEGYWATSWLPGGVHHENSYYDNVSILDATHPVVAGMPGGGPVTDAQLDDWFYSTHGYFTGLLPGTNKVIGITVDPQNQPIYIQYPFGSGYVLATMQTLEWLWPGCSGESKPNAIAGRNVLRNEILHAQQLRTPCITSPHNTISTCDMQRGDILLSHSLGATYVAQEALFNGYWTHAGIYLGDGVVTESSGRIDCSPWWQVWACLSPQPGVVTDRIQQSTFWTSTDWAILRVTATAAQRDAACVYAVNQTGKDYNWNYLNKDTEGSFYCSQLVWRAYENQGIDLDSNLSALNAALTWIGPWGVAIGAAVLAAVPPDDIYFDADKTIIKQRPGLWAWLRRTLLRHLSPGDLYVTDPQGRHTGVDPVTGEVVEEIPGAFYSGPDAEPEFISIEDVSGPWQVQIVGNDAGPYTLAGEQIDIQNHSQPQIEGTIEPGAVDSYVSAYGEAAGEGLEILLDSDGDGMADAYEAAHTCLDPAADDSTGDPDSDGLTSLTEYTLYSTDPCLSDTDFDGCTDGEELGSDPALGGQRDPLDPHDFYDVPVPTAFNGGTPANRDKAITIIDDLLAVLEYAGTSDGGLCNSGPDRIPGTSDDRCYDQDNNSDSQDDGLLYDRRAGAPWSDAPDGAITIVEDVLLVLAQSGHSCQATP